MMSKNTGLSQHQEITSAVGPGTSSLAPSRASEEATNEELPVASEVLQFTEQYSLTKYLDTFQKAAYLATGDYPLATVPELSTAEKLALQWEKDRKWRQPKMLYFTILVCSIGAIEQGWAQTGMNGANLYFPSALGIGSNSKHDNLVVGLINSGIYLSTGAL